MKKPVVWQVGANGPVRLPSGTIPLESRLEDWIENDVTIAVDDVLVIDRQTITEWGTRLDLLGMDADGRLVILELKRGQTLRDTVAQAIEYAAWAASLAYEEIAAILVGKFGSMEDFEARFQEKFSADIPEQFNEGQRIIVVAPEIDAVTTTVVQYLASAYQMPIDVAYFDVFTSPSNETYLVRMAAVAEEQARQHAPREKRAPKQTIEQIRSIAVQTGREQPFDELLKLQALLPRVVAYTDNVNLKGRSLTGTPLAGVVITPSRTNYPDAIDVGVSPENLQRLFGRSAAEVDVFIQSSRAYLPPHTPKWTGWERFGISTLDDARRFVEAFRRLVAVPASSEIQ